MSNEIRIMVTDDHQIVLDGIKSLINRIPGFRLVGEAHNGREAIDLLKHLHVDVLLMDLDMPEMNGMEATSIIKEKYPVVRVLILTMHNEKALINKVMESGASGFVLKNSSQDELMEAIKKVHSGQQYFSAEVTMTLLSKTEHRTSSNLKTPVDLSQLTERETEILRLIAEGNSNKEIGEQLFISHRTVDTHRTNLMKKLAVHNIAGLIKFAINAGLVN